MRTHRSLIGATVTAILFGTFATHAAAACVTAPNHQDIRAGSPKTMLTPTTLQYAGSPAAAPFDDREGDQRGAVGLWHALFLLGNGPDKYDESFQTIHADGTEMMISNGLPPALGNVCVGIWKQDGGTLTLRHMTWNWGGDGQLAGTFMMIVTFRLDRGGRSYSGTWSAKNYDVDGTLIPELNADGIVRAVRVTVD